MEVNCPTYNAHYISVSVQRLQSSSPLSTHFRSVDRTLNLHGMLVVQKAHVESPKLAKNVKLRAPPRLVNVISVSGPQVEIRSADLRDPVMMTAVRRSAASQTANQRIRFRGIGSEPLLCFHATIDTFRGL